MPDDKMSLDDFLSGEKEQTIHAIIEQDPDSSKNVLVKPWFSGIGCLCDEGIPIPKASISGVTPTDERHYCSEGEKRIVRIHLDPEMTFKPDVVFRLMHKLAASKIDAVHGQGQLPDHIEHDTASTSRAGTTVWIPCGDCSGYYPLNTRCCNNWYTCPPGYRCHQGRRGVYTCVSLSNRRKTTAPSCQPDWME